MRAALALVLLVLGCGVHRGRAALPDPLQGAWFDVRRARADGPYRWSAATFGADTFDLSEGEVSKDSGSWCAAGRYKVLAGTGGADDPYVVRLFVKQRRRGERHPGPRGLVLKARLSHVDGRLTVALPSASLELSREVPAEARPIRRHACAR
ncbi:MAG: hypothetical protein R3A51_20425 [Nannocystaceae bacterium]|nr:hypothetical protein [Myxococcales bacterium]